MDQQKQAAAAILADPEFDVEGFVKNINIHYQNRNIARMLGAHPGIFLGLLESGEHRFLEIMSDFVDMGIFKQLADDGYEMWSRTKKSQNTWRKDSYWYGVVINPELAIHYRALGHSRRHQTSFKVVSGKGAADKLRKKWKRLRMYPEGEAQSDKAPHPVYKIRKHIWEWAKQHLGLKISNYYYSRAKAPFYWDHGNRYSYKRSNDNNYSRLQFEVLQSGKKHIRVRIGTTSGDVLKQDDLRKTTYGVSIGIKIPVDDPQIAFKAIEWAATATKENKKFYPQIKAKLEAYKAAAGIK